jgi:hypothetical protein
MMAGMYLPAHIDNGMEVGIALGGHFEEIRVYSDDVIQSELMPESSIRINKAVLG